MPTVKLLHDSNVTLKGPAHQHHQQQRFAPHGTPIYLALAAALVVISLVRLAARRYSFHLPSWAQGPSQLACREPEIQKDSKSHYSWDRSAPTTTTDIAPANKPLFFRPGFVEGGSQTVWAGGLLLASPAADRARTGLTASVLPGMEEQGEGTGSRGVSTSTAASRHQLSLTRADAGSRKSSSRSPRSHKSSRSPPGRDSDISDGSPARAKQHKGKGLMDGDSWGGVLDQEHTAAGHMYAGTDDAMHSSQDGGDGPDYDHDASASTPRFSRPVPPLPLTPPTLYTGTFTFEDRRPSYAVSIPGQLDSSFIHQSNPDYISSSTSAEYRHDPSPKSATTTTTPRRRSYTKAVPIGIPIPSGSSSSSSHQSPDAAGAWAGSSTDTFSPASYPPSSPQLPPPPPSGYYDEVIYPYDGGQDEEMDLQGEIISVMDDDGHGWKRHTRVYGGGVCLACVAAGERQGGFYGDKVPLSERR